MTDGYKQNSFAHQRKKKTLFIQEIPNGFIYK